MSKHLLTKSAFRFGLACDRYFWIYQNARESLPEVDESTQAIFDQGHLIGNLAKTLYPGGTEIDWSSGHKAGIAQTGAAVGERKPIFEAGFQDGMTHARADILNPSSRGKWDLIEVKSSTSAKEDHLYDVAFQKHVYEGAGIGIDCCSVMHVNRNYVRIGKLDVEQLLECTDVTDEIRPYAPGIPDEIKRQLSVMSLPDPPDPALVPMCSECTLYPECWAFLPDHNVISLYRIGQKARELLDQNILAIKDIPDGYPLTPKQSIQVDCVKTGKPYIELPAIREFLRRLQYPTYFLDFETFMTAVPPYDDSRPYDNVPFQYSLHIVRSPGSGVEHKSFLSDGKRDPRQEILKMLKSELGRKGSIVAYNAGYEIRVLKSCIVYFPEYGAWLQSILPRFVDLLIPFREFYYYHPDQNGSNSLKAVLPALTGRGYAGLDISEGQTASLRFMEMAFGEVDEAGRMEIRDALEAYCSQDTEGMIDIVEALRNLTL